MKKILFRIILLALLACFVLAWFFMHEVNQKISNSAATMFSEAPLSSILSDERTPRIVGYRLTDERTDPAMVVVDDLQASMPDATNVIISLRLTNKGGADWPWLRVYLQDGQGRTTRNLDFSPKSYPHGQSFVSEVVTLNVPLRAGEQRFTASAFYPN
jgi:hypothetical protein